MVREMLDVPVSRWGLLRPARYSGDGPHHSRQKTFFIAYAILVALAISVNFPGRANSDTIDMLYQARNLDALNDWHAPFITFVYGLLSPIFGSPAGALILQAAIIMVWPAYIFSRIVHSRSGFGSKLLGISVWCIVCSAFIALAGQIWKDMLVVGFAGILLVLAAALFYEFRRGQIKTLAVAATASCLLAFCLVRPPNIAIIALAAFACAFFTASSVPKWRLALSIAAGIAGLFAAQTLVERQFFAAKHSHPIMPLIVFDLAGISVNTGKDVFQALEGPTKPTLPPWTCYTPKAADDFMWGKCRDYSVILGQDFPRLLRFWLREIRMHPIAYLQHRLNFSARTSDPGSTAERSRRT